jgi:cell division protein FtsI/penicillin-binding protein 2
VIASANAPDFDPNHYNDIYTIKPLTEEQWYIVDNETYLDFPVYVKTWWETRLATRQERSETLLPKYVANNPLWPNLFVDKNIAYPYEPWSIFKAFTFDIWLDQSEIDLYDRYTDLNSEIKVWPYTIKNASIEACRWIHTFLYALQYSCNVGIVRIAQKLTQSIFYNYIEKLWFGAMTYIELAWEDPWFVEWISTVSVARFFNNVFGQWLLVTPIQIAAGYGAMLNGWTYIKPTILSKICEAWTTKCQNNDVKIVRQIFEPRISDILKFALTKVIEIPENGKYADIPQYKVWWKSWTSQISFKWRYMRGDGWTNWSFVGIITEDNMQYIVVIQVRRPRSTQRWNTTAWVVFKDMATFLINYATLRWEKFEIN